MAKQQFVFSRNLTHDIDCPHCSTRYQFTRTVEAAHAELDRLSEGMGGEAVRCPSCRKLGPGMLTNHLLMGVFIVVWIVACLGAALLILWLAAASGALFWMLGLLALAGAGIGAVTLLIWLFGGTIIKGQLPPA